MEGRGIGGEEGSLERKEEGAVLIIQHVCTSLEIIYGATYITRNNIVLVIQHRYNVKRICWSHPPVIVGASPDLVVAVVFL